MYYCDGAIYLIKNLWNKRDNITSNR